MNMRLAPARLPASSGLGCDLAAGSDRVCMTMSGARSCDRGRGCPTGLPWPRALGGQEAAVPPGRAVRPPAAARGTHRRLRVGSVGLLAPAAAVLDGGRALRRRAASGAGQCFQALCQNPWSWGKLEDKGVC